MHELTVIAQTVDGEFFTNVASIEVKCDKPDCSVIDLAAFEAAQSGEPSDLPPPCIRVCEFSEVTLFTDFNPDYSYSWTVPEGFSTGSNDAEIIVEYGAAGNSTLSLTVSGPGGFTESFAYCVEILAGPEAEFDTNGYACLDSPMTFENLFPGAASYTWDFGDSTVVNDNATFVQHTYSEPGTYTVVLTATLPVSDNEGNELCCCTRTFEQEVEVDDLPGPDIFCVSTQCEGDSASYSTNAENCSSYIWTVTDPDGNPVAFDGQGTPEISLQWNQGPFGIVSLEVDGCDDQYCDAPVSVVVPVIPDQSEVSGPEIVCAGSTHTYTVPKWPNASYEWEVDGGVLVGSPSGNMAVVQWGSGPTGSIDVSYTSDFLTGLSEYDENDCSGIAEIEVLIRPELQLFNSASTVCRGETGFIGSLSSPPGTYNWSISPSVPFNDLGGVIEVEWDVPAGFYTITAEPTDPTAYCNGPVSVGTRVLEIDAPALPVGPLTVCPNGTYLYTGVAEPGAGLVWEAPQGSLSNTAGTSVSVTWDGSPPYTIILAQETSGTPTCLSDTVQLHIDVFEVEGPLELDPFEPEVCNNSSASYTLTPAQVPEAEILWSISPTEAGSVTDITGPASVDVQWNDFTGLATLTASVVLCGDTVNQDFDLILNAADKPVVSQVGFICPGGNGTLEVAQSYADYSWSTGASGPSAQVTSGGWYDVTVTDSDGCQATTFFEATESPSPVASISASGPRFVCIGTGGTVTLIAQTAPNYSFTWLADGNLVQGPSPSSNYTHNFQNEIGTSNYQVVVENTVTGCTATSGILTVGEECCGPCTGEPHSFEADFQVQTPDCNLIEFSFTASPEVNFGSWSFGDGTLSGATNPTHSFAEAGCYTVTASGSVENIFPGEEFEGDSICPPSEALDPFCPTSTSVNVCVPLAAFFDFEALGCREFQFNNLSTYLDIPDGGPVTFSEWDFDGVTVSSFDATYTFPNAGTFPVTLTVGNASGCLTSFTLSVNVESVGVPVPDPGLTEACQGESLAFSGSAANAVAYYWDFGDGSSFVGQSTQHSYDEPDTYTVTLTAEGRDGCTESSTFQTEIFPAVPPGVIDGPDFVCEGAVAQLTAPPGFDYQWDDAAQSQTQTISVEAGSYSVVLTNSFGCSRELGPVELVEIPAPEVAIAGPGVICDNACITLNAIADPSATVVWIDIAAGGIFPGGNGFTAEVCAADAPIDLQAEVTDLNGCRGSSTPFSVSTASSPQFTVDADGSGCAGDPNILSASPIDPSLNYLWNTGSSGPELTTFNAGTFTLTATDPLTGCRSSASASINPLPDLCSMPVGCYEECDSISFCVAPGLGIYQWFVDSDPIPGETTNCILITETGVYTLSITSPDGCTAVSEELDIVIIDCSDPCVNFSISASAVPEQEEGEEAGAAHCCFLFSYEVDAPDAFSISFTASGASLAYDPADLDPAFTTQSASPAEVRVSSALPGAAIPQGIVNDFIALCLTDVQSIPQTVYVDWLDEEGEVICRDSLLFDCPDEPPCLYITDEEIICEEGQTFYTFTACNPGAVTWPVGFLELIDISPSFLVLSQSQFDLSANPIQPGSCATFTIELTGPNIAGEEFCFTLVGHAADPAEEPGTVCCSLEDQNCIEIPPCDPCEFVNIENVIPQDEEGCCYVIELFNGFDPEYFDAIAIETLSGGTSFDIINPSGSGWFASGYTGTEVTFIPVGFPGAYVPLGSFTLPEICIETNIAPGQQLLIRWIKDGETVCEDEFETFCEPDCGYVLDEILECTEDGLVWTYEGNIKNMTPYVISEAVINFDTPGFSALNQTIALGNLAPGDIFSSFFFQFEAPAFAGQEICFTVTLHEQNANGEELNCCDFTHCITLPECPELQCPCDEEWEAAVQAGFQDIALGPSTFEFTLNGYLEGLLNDTCDIVLWGMGPVTYGYQIVSEPQVHTFTNGEFPDRICYRIRRFTDDGKICDAGFCAPMQAIYGAPPAIGTFPNPSSGSFVLTFDNPENEEAEIQVFDPTGRVAFSQLVPKGEHSMRRTLHLNDNFSPGAYLVKVQRGGEILTTRIVVAY